MMISKYCLELGMNLEGFLEFEQEVKTEAQEIFNKAKTIRPQDTGMYFPTSELIELKEQRDYFIVDELRRLGVEFIENLKLYRI